MEDGMKVWVAPQRWWEALDMSKIASVAVLLVVISILGFCANKKMENSAKRHQRLEQLAISK